MPAPAPAPGFSAGDSGAGAGAGVFVADVAVGWFLAGLAIAAIVRP